MGFLEVLTLVFIALKLMGMIDWGWLTVMSPMIFAFSMYFIMLICFIVYSLKSDNNTNNRLNRFGIKKRKR